MVDTQRMRRVLDRVQRPPPPPPRPGPPIPPPPPPIRGPAEWLRQEGELLAILRRMAGKSPTLRGRIQRLIEDSRRRQKMLRRWESPPMPPPPPMMRPEPLSGLLRSAESLSGELRDEYGREAGRGGPDSRMFERLTRSAADTERSLRELQRRMEK